jgi:amidase
MLSQAHVPFEPAKQVFQFPGHPNQATLEDAVELNLTSAEYDMYLKKLREIARTQGVDRILNEYDADVIIGPADSLLSSIAAASGTEEI